MDRKRSQKCFKIPDFSGYLSPSIHIASSNDPNSVCVSVSYKPHLPFHNTTHCSAGLHGPQKGRAWGLFWLSQHHCRQPRGVTGPSKRQASTHQKTSLSKTKIFPLSTSLGPLPNKPCRPCAGTDTEIPPLLHSQSGQFFLARFSGSHICLLKKNTLCYSY